MKISHVKKCLSSQTWNAVWCKLIYWKIHSDPQFYHITMNFLIFGVFLYVYTFVREKENGTEGL